MYGFYVLFHMPFHGCTIVTAVTFGDVPIEHVNRHFFKFSSTTKVLKLFCKNQICKNHCQGLLHHIISFLGEAYLHPPPQMCRNRGKDIGGGKSIGIRTGGGSSFYQGSLWYSLVNSLGFFKYLIQSSS